MSENNICSSSLSLKTIEHNQHQSCETLSAREILCNLPNNGKFCIYLFLTYTIYFSKKRVKENNGEVYLKELSISLLKDRICCTRLSWLGSLLNSTVCCLVCFPNITGINMLSMLLCYFLVNTIKL